jgi:cytochrome oxidase Cu insertion factor (SCO1/SenC/PrrC family)
MNKRIRQIALLAVLGFTIGTASAWYEVNEAQNTASYANIEPASGSPLAGAAIGGPFSLVDHNGKAVTEKDYAGNYKLVFFGFTSCPDVCPAGLEKMSAALKTLGPKAEEIQPLFITIDPERDTPEVMKEYVAMFHPRLTGLTGSVEQVDAVLAAYKVYAAKAEGGDPENYLMNHSAYTFLMGPDGQPLTMFGAEDAPGAMAKEILQFLDQKTL